MEITSTKAPSGASAYLHGAHPTPENAGKQPRKKTAMWPGCVILTAWSLVLFIERSFHFKMVSSLLFVVAKCQHSIEGQDIGDTIAAERDPPPSSQSHIAHRHFSDTGRYSKARAHTHTHILYTRIVYTLRLQADLRTHAQTDRQTRQTDTHARTHNLYEVSEQTITLTSSQFMELQP